MAELAAQAEAGEISLRLAEASIALLDTQLASAQQAMKDANDKLAEQDRLIDELGQKVADLESKVP